VDPLAALSLVALHPLSRLFPHADDAVLVLLEVLEAFQAEGHASLHEVLLVLQLVAADPAFEASLASVLLPLAQLVSLQPPADVVELAAAGPATQESCSDCQLAFTAGGTLLTVPDFFIIVCIVDVCRTGWISFCV
jgi:hypothetical protein